MAHMPNQKAKKTTIGSRDEPDQVWRFPPARLGTQVNGLISVILC
jgi:hypothetical protein